MLDDDQTALARVQNALVKAQQIHNQEAMKPERSTAGAPQDPNETLGFLELYLAILQRHRHYLFAATARRRDQKR